MTMMLPTTLSMLFLMTPGCPPEELPQPAEPVALASEDSVRGLLDQANGGGHPGILDSPGVVHTENDLTGDSVLRTGWISWRRLQENVTVGLLLEEVVDRARRKKSRLHLAEPFLWEVEHEAAH